MANTTRTFDVAFQFGQGLLDEYKNQSEKEKEINVELTKFSDVGDFKDGVTSLWAIEISFYTGIVAPLYKLLQTMVPDLADFKLQMEDNKRQWRNTVKNRFKKKKKQKLNIYIYIIYCNVNLICFRIIYNLVVM